ncbi:hypothetical protein, partial [Burkholderia multivorans]
MREHNLHTVCEEASCRWPPSRGSTRASSA